MFLFVNYKKEVMAEAKHQVGAKLTKFIRLTIYGFLDLNSTLLIAAKLSKEERAGLQKSELARSNKDFVLHINERTRPSCLLHYGGLGSFLRQYDTQISLA